MLPLLGFNYAQAVDDATTCGVSDTYFNPTLSMQLQWAYQGRSELSFRDLHSALFALSGAEDKAAEVTSLPTTLRAIKPPLPECRLLTECPILVSGETPSTSRGRRLVLSEFGHSPCRTEAARRAKQRATI